MKTLVYFSILLSSIALAGTVSDNEITCDFYEELSESGNSNSENALVSFAGCFRSGIGRSQSFLKAESLYLKAIAEFDSASAKNDLASMYFYSGFFSGKEDEAFSYLWSANLQGYSRAKFGLFLAYLNGLGVKKSDALAQVYLEKSAIDAHEGAVFLFTLGSCGILDFMEGSTQNCHLWKYRLKKITNFRSFKDYIDSYTNNIMFRQYVFSKNDMSRVNLIENLDLLDFKKK